ncbi:MAG: hypothetical protein GTO63_20790 [Anaerolineae bacterium]|nr:hypothetical protein [Anaerolineae bacterium]NIN97217.1 hypothetical protein [Anaerolineae bacterium]NIQ80170.1 hypothetical protein [Anaerolineae bacterium]
MSKLRRVSGFLKAELEAVFSLVPLIVVAVVGALVLTGTSVTVAYPAFQSPISPVGTPAPTPTGVPAPPPTEAPVVPPAEPTQSPPAGPPEVPGEVETPASEPQPSPTEGAPEATQAAGDPGEEARGIRRLRGLSWAVLIDTLVVGLSSVWLCCGGIVLVLFVVGVIAAFVLRVE